MISWLRRLAVPVVVVVAAFGVSSCSSTLNDAATVKYHDSTGAHTVDISQSQLNRELEQLAKNKPFVQEVKAQYLQHSDAKNSLDQALVARWLSTLIAQTAIDGEFSADKLEITSSDQASAKQAREQEFGPAFDSFSKSFQQLLIDRDARAIAIQNYYTSCPSGRLVYHLATPNHDAAEAAFNLIRSGQTFESVARAKSVDTTTGQVGGAMGCLIPGSMLPEIENVAKQVPFDVVTVPVKTRYGYDLILVRKWTPTDSQQFGTQLQTAAGNAVRAREQALHVWLDPRYGSWQPSTAGQASQSLPIVTPPVPDPHLTRDGTPVGVSVTTTVPAGG